jgi:hypothetical protein
MRVLMSAVRELFSWDRIAQAHVNAYRAAHRRIKLHARATGCAVLSIVMFMSAYARVSSSGARVVPGNVAFARLCTEVSFAFRRRFFCRVRVTESCGRPMQPFTVCAIMRSG